MEDDLLKKPGDGFIISIIIVSYNTAELLCACLSSLEKEIRATGLTEKTEVFVVDNDSTDGSGVAVRDRFPGIMLIQNKTNFGFAKANNQAIKASKGRFLFFLNPDAEVCPGALRTMIDYMETHREIGLAGTSLIFPDGSPQPSVEGSYPGSRHAAKELQGLPGSIAWVMGAGMIARTVLIKDIGGFDERFFLYGEDIDLCLAVRKSGYAIGHIPDAVLIHHEGQSERKNLPLRVFEKKIKAAILFFQKHYSPKSRARIKQRSILQARWRILTLRLELLLFPRDAVRGQKLQEYELRLALYTSLL